MFKNEANFSAGHLVLLLLGAFVGGVASSAYFTQAVLPAQYAAGQEAALDQAIIDQAKETLYEFEVERNEYLEKIANNGPRSTWSINEIGRVSRYGAFALVAANFPDCEVVNFSHSADIKRGTSQGIETIYFVKSPLCPR